MRYSIEEKTLTDMADAVRNKVVPGELVVQDTTMASYPDHIINIDISNMAGNRFRITIKDVEFFGSANKLNLAVYNTSGTLINKSYLFNAQFPVVFEEYLDKTEYVRITADGNGINFTYIIEAIDDEGKPHTLTPQEMIDKLNAVAPSPLDEDLTFTGNMEYRFAHNGWNWFIRKYSDKIKINNPTNLENCFYYSNEIETIPFIFECNINTDLNISSMFNSCHKLKTLPKIINVKVTEINDLFSSCRMLREIPDDFTGTWDWSYIDNLNSSYAGRSNNIFSGCKSLRKFPVALISHANRTMTSYYSHLYYSTFQNCYCLDEVNGLYVHPSEITSNLFYSTNIFQSCYRLKNFTFAPYEGSVNWSNQTIDMCSSTDYTLGYCPIFSQYEITGYNSGITADKEVKDDATYQALKNDPDWFTAKIEYSRYNHDSAVNTINSLPTTTGTGCTIKFKGASGSLTDGGAINTLTEEEIAVAAAKGWVVALT